MALDLTAGAPPIFLGKNYFNKDANTYGGTFSVSTGSSFGPRLYDMDPFAYWLSVASVDAVTETIISQLYEGYAIATRVVDFVALLNINLKDFTIDYSTDGGSSWTNMVTVTGNALPDYRLDKTSAPVTMNAIRVQATTTFAITGLAAGGEKQVGTICLHDYLYQTTQPPNDLTRKYYDSQKIVVLADFSEDITYTKRSPASHEFYGCDMSFANLPDADRDALRTVRRTNPAFCLLPEPGERKGDLFYGRFVGDWEDKPTDEFKGSGNSLTLGFKEIS